MYTVTFTVTDVGAPFTMREREVARFTQTISAIDRKWALHVASRMCRVLEGEESTILYTHNVSQELP